MMRSLSIPHSINKQVYCSTDIRCGCGGTSSGSVTCCCRLHWIYRPFDIFLTPKQVTVPPLYTLSPLVRSMSIWRRPQPVSPLNAVFLWSAVCHRVSLRGMQSVTAIARRVWAVFEGIGRDRVYLLYPEWAYIVTCPLRTVNIQISVCCERLTPFLCPRCSTPQTVRALTIG